MNLRKLDNQELLASTLKAARAERLAMIELLRHLVEVQRRKYYLQRAYSSLWEFIRKELRCC